MNRRIPPVLLLAIPVALGVLSSGCPATPGVPKKPHVTPGPTLGSAPVRRLTQEELNHTAHDLLAGVDLPVVTLNDGDGKGFDGDVLHQVPSDLAVEQLRAAAGDIAKAAVARKDVLLPRQPSGDLEDQRAAGHEMLAQLLPRAFRRPAEQRELDAYGAFFDTALDANNFDVALRLVVQAVLQAPPFVYRIELGAGPVKDGVALAPYEMASRLSYFLWGSMPDQALFDAAAGDALSKPEDLAAQARRMLDDPRAKDAVLSFHRQWLSLDKVLTQNKDQATFPEWNDDLRKSMRTEADKMIEEVVFGTGDARLQTLLTTTKTRVNAQLADVYGVAPPAQDWDLVDLPADQRAGLVTNAAFLASGAHQVFGSPVLRGVFVLGRFICQAPPPPPPNINVSPPDPAGQTTPTTNRQRFEQHSADANCIGCHATIDGVGMGLEGYDAIGRFRTEDNGFPVDDSGDLSLTPVGGTFHGGPELAHKLADSSAVHDCVARQWMTFSRGRIEEPADKTEIDDVRAAFSSVDGDIKELLVAIVKEPAFRTIPAAVGTGVSP